MPVAHIFLGDTLWELGKKQDAIKAWQAAIATGEKRPNESVNKYLIGNAQIKLKTALKGM